MSKTKGTIVAEACRRFPDADSLALARYIIGTHGDVFEQNVERARSSIRYYRGNIGNQNRAHAHSSGAIIPRAPKLPRTWSEKRTPYRLSPGLWLITADWHIPFHNPRAVEAAIAYGISQGINGIVIDGDMQDCASLGKWVTRQRDFVREVEVMADTLDWLRDAVGDRTIIWKLGNHENRLQTYYASHAPALMGLPQSDLGATLSCESRNIEIVESGQIIKAGALSILHGHEVRVSSSAVNPARGLFLRTKTTAMCAHLHRSSSHDESKLGGELLTCWSLGCLCDLSPDYNPHANGWTWGFALVHVEDKGNMFEVENRRILSDGSYKVV